MEKELISQLHKNFEDSAHENGGVQFWYARELQILLGYDRWENFENAIKKAKVACDKAKQAVTDHFRDVTKMVKVGSKANRDIQDVVLTRYACYLIAQNGDPHKDEVAFAMTYFAVQTRKLEIIEERIGQWERLHDREKLSLSEKELSGIIFERGIDSKGFARIRSSGDGALFGGYSTRDMKKKLGIPDSRPLGDFLPAVSLKAKEFANTITNHNLKQNRSLSGEQPITEEHVRNNRNVRHTLIASGIRPELLPAAEDTKKVERRLKTEAKKIPRAKQPLKELPAA